MEIFLPGEKIILCTTSCKQNLEYRSEDMKLATQRHLVLRLRECCIISSLPYAFMVCVKTSLNSPIMHTFSKRNDMVGYIQAAPALPRLKMPMYQMNRKMVMQHQDELLKSTVHVPL
jgi:hypothetical protein